MPDRKKQEFPEKRQREWASNKAAKERLVSQMASLANSKRLPCSEGSGPSADAVAIDGTVCEGDTTITCGSSTSRQS